MNQKTKKTIKKITNIFTNILLVLSLLLLAFSAYTAYTFKSNPEEAYLFGYKPVLILTGSMEPTLKVNGVAIVQKATYDDVDVGDIVMYQAGDKLITHRIVKKTEEGITTKGENNNSEDSYLLTNRNIKAKVVSIWNWTATPINSIWPDGINSPISVKGLLKWVAFPLLIIIVLEVLIKVIKKVSRMDDDKLDKKINAIKGRKKRNKDNERQEEEGNLS